MDSMIKEINENLMAIIDTIKENRDNSISTLDNIQNQMDKKVEEAKKYKVQVDSAKEKINMLEQENKSLELSLKELQDKYSKMNLVSIIEAGNREIKSKINDNLININKEKEHIAELTNRARTIKDLLINLKKDKTIKEERLENTKIIYEYYSERINEVIDYAFNHSNNLSDYKVSFKVNEVNNEFDDTSLIQSNDLENTMVFDEIANIDENKNFKDEMSFIDEQIDNNISSDKKQDEDKYNEIIDRSLDSSLDKENNTEFETEEEVQEPLDTTQVFDSVLGDLSLEENIKKEDNVLDSDVDNLDVDKDTNLSNDTTDVDNLIEDTDKVIDLNNDNESNDNLNVVLDKTSEVNTINTDIFDDNKIEDKDKEPEELIDEENKNRIEKINNLFSTLNDNKVDVPLTVKPSVSDVETKIDNAYKDIFGMPLEENDLNKKEPTLTDIFGNPISSDELSNEVKIGKKIEDLFNENGLEFNKFREDEKNYLKQIYDEEKFNNIINSLKRNKINLDNLYYAFNIFGEMTANELENLISKLLNVGQSVEAIGIVLEKLPKVKKYNLDEAIMSYGDYVKDMDISELIMKAKELYNNGGNR